MTMRPLPFLLSVGALLASASVSADVANPAAARAHLREGYALKQQGKCQEAVPHFVESARLDRQPKALLNLADCEEQLGKLEASLAHFVEARDLARTRRDETLNSVAEGRLKALDKRMPKLTVKLAKDAPSDTVVTRDGVELGSISLGAALPLDPGTHTIIARSGGVERSYQFKIDESESKALEVTPKEGTITKGGSRPEPSAMPAPNTMAALANSPTTPAPFEAGTSSNLGETQRTLGFIIGGVGIAGLAVGTIFGLKNLSDGSTSNQLCTTSNPCDAAGLASYRESVDGARSARTISTVGFAIGGATLVTAGLLIFTAPRASSTGLRFTPSMGTNWAGAQVGGAW